jgi:glucose/arabinose dehydrogenase
VGLAYEVVAPDADFPIFLEPRADGELFLITKAGVVWQLQGEEFVVHLDLRNQVSIRANEQGMLGMAWHPTDPERLFLHYSDNNGDTVISEFNGAEERVLLRVDQPASNHNGGTIAFGPDGYLYIGLGDGGGGGDTYRTGQPVDDLLGNLLRIVVDGDPYAIPPGNPYADTDGADEVWANGLRNPWRFWFDENLIYIGDVGQNDYEEINVAPADAAGLNYGWPITEGLHCFEPASGCELAGLTLPVVEVEHGDGRTCSIAGGVVYRGALIPELAGHYFYSDFCGGWLRSFLIVDGLPTDARDWTEQVGVPGNIVSFGTDAAGEVYVLTTSQVLKIVPLR